MSDEPKAPTGYRFDAFADVCMGQSLFQMQPEDWLVPDPDLERIDAGHVCKHGIRHPWACNECDNATIEMRNRELKDLPR